MGCTNSILQPSFQKDQIEKGGEACTQASQKQGIQFAVDSKIIRKGSNQREQTMEIKTDAQKEAPGQNYQDLPPVQNQVPSNCQKSQKISKRKKNKSIPKSFKASKHASRSETFLYNPEQTLPIIQELSVQQLQSNLFKSQNSNLSMFPNPSTCLNMQNLHENQKMIAINKEREIETFGKHSFKHKNSYV